MLNWSLTQSKDFHIINKKNSIKEIVHETIDICSISAEAKYIKLICLSDEEIEFVCDKNITQIVLRNIIMNAVKFSNKESDINIEYKLSPERELIFTVKDNGIGMSKEEIEKIYDSAALLSSQGTGSEQGTGLGLKMSIELIKKQNGKIEISGEHGKGCTVKIILPEQSSEKEE